MNAIKTLCTVTVIFGLASCTATTSANQAGTNITMTSPSKPKTFSRNPDLKNPPNTYQGSPLGDDVPLIPARLW